MINIEVKEIVKLEEGLHKGEIVKVELRTQPYEYVDLHISAPTKNGSDAIVKAGYAAFITKETALGLLLTRFGIKLEKGSNVNVEALVGRECTFMSTTQVKGDKKYTKVINETVTPINITEAIGNATEEQQLDKVMDEAGETKKKQAS